MPVEFAISRHAIDQYRDRAIQCCERWRSNDLLATVIRRQVGEGNWTLAGGETFIVQCGPLVPKANKLGSFKTASVSYTFVIETQVVVTTLGFMMRPNSRKKQRKRRRARVAKMRLLQALAAS